MKAIKTILLAIVLVPASGLLLPVGFMPALQALWVVTLLGGVGLAVYGSYLPEES